MMKVWTIEWDDDTSYEEQSGLTAIAATYEAAVRFLRERTGEALDSTSKKDVPFVVPHVGPTKLAEGYYRWDWDLQRAEYPGDDNIIWRIESIEVVE